MEPSLLQLWPAGTDFSSVTEQEILDTINDVKVNSVTGVPMEARRFLGEVVEEEGRVVAAGVSRPPPPPPPRPPTCSGSAGSTPPPSRRTTCQSRWWFTC